MLMALRQHNYCVFGTIVTAKIGNGGKNQNKVLLLNNAQYFEMKVSWKVEVTLKVQWAYSSLAASHVQQHISTYEEHNVIDKDPTS